MTAYPRKTWIQATVGALLLAVFLLVEFGTQVEASKLAVGPGFVDQIGYVTTARGLADTGELESGLVYPAYADQPGWRPYMPGHYMVLALSFQLFGEGPWPSRLPNLIAFVLACLAVGLVALQRYGPRAALFAVVLFGTFPLQLLYAFTAMAETTFLAAGVLAFALFVFAGRRAVFVGPLLLAIPFLFRETGLLWIVPMLAVLWSAGGTGRSQRAVALVVASALIAWAANAWQLADGKGSLPLDWVAGSGFNYRDATATPPELSTGEWLLGALRNGGRNLEALAERAGASVFEPPLIAFVVFLGLTGLQLVWGWRRRREDLLPLAAGLSGLAILAASFLLYDVKAHKVIRSGLFLTPLLALGTGAWIASLGTGSGARKLGWGLTIVLGLIGLLASPRAQKELENGAETLRAGRELIESLGHDDTRLLIGPHDLFGQYAIEHWPVRCAFLPANDATLEALAERFEVGTLVTPTVYVGERMSPEAIRAAGLVQVLETPGGQFRVYQRPR